MAHANQSFSEDTEVKETGRENFLILKISQKIVSYEKVRISKI